MRSIAHASVVLFLIATGCSKSEEPVPAAPEAPASATAARPVDHLGENEVLEGPDKALGLVLPRRTRIDHAFLDVVYVTAPFALATMIEYVRSHVRDGTYTKGERTATFARVKIPTKPGQEFDVRLELKNWAETKIEVRDVTRPPTPNLPDEEARWRQVGMTKDGKLIDPNKLE